MHGVIRGTLIALVVALLVPALPLVAQETPETFRWIDFHSPKDQDVVLWVTKSLETENWTAIREIGVQYDAALVITTQRESPQASPASDTFNVWSVSLTNHLVTSLLKGVNLRLLDWMLFSLGHPRELGALYNDCRECNATLYFTAFYYDQRQHGWAARWLRGAQTVPLEAPMRPRVCRSRRSTPLWPTPMGTSWSARGTTSTTARQSLRTTTSISTTLTPISGLDRTQLLAGKALEAMQHRLCTATGVVSGLAKGQDSPLCAQLLNGKLPRKRYR